MYTYFTFSCHAPQTYFTSPMGKTAIDEQHPQFGGIYVGDITVDSVKHAVETADFNLYIGALKSDFNTGSFSWHIKPEETVELHSDHTTIQVRRCSATSLLGC